MKGLTVRPVHFTYDVSGGKDRIVAITTGARTLVSYTYTDLNLEGVAGRLRSAEHPADGNSPASSYSYTYVEESPSQPGRRLLETVKDQDDRIVEQHTWSQHPLDDNDPIIGGWVVSSTRNAGE